MVIAIHKEESEAEFKTNPKRGTRMTLKKILPAAVMAFAAATASAGGFDGPFVQLGIGGSSTKTTLNGGGGNASSTQGSFNGLAAAGWSQSIGPSGFNLAANLFYVIGNQKAGNWNGTDSGTNYNIVGNYNNKLQNTFGISVEPGWNFTDTTLGYVKLAWVNSKSKFSGTESCTGSGCVNVDYGSGSTSKNINGFGYGLGIKQLITKNVFVGADLMGVTYGSASLGDGDSLKASQFMGFASVGYKF